MGLFDMFNPQPTAPTVPSVLPDAARQQILRGQLPILQPNNLFLKNGETCHYADRAIYEKKTINQRKVRRNTGRSIPGLIKGTRIHVGSSTTDTVQDVKYTQIKGVLYITTRRIIFAGGEEGFDRKIDDLVAVTPYANCVEFQFSKETLRVFVPDGNLPHFVLRMI